MAKATEKAGKKPNAYKIAVIPGDGIGKEVVPEGIRVLEAAGAQVRLRASSGTHFDWSCEHFTQDRPDDAGGRARPASAATTRSSSARSASPACPTTSRSGAC